MTNELTKALADATSHTPEEIEAAAKDFELPPPWEWEVVKE